MVKQYKGLGQWLRLSLQSGRFRDRGFESGHRCYFIMIILLFTGKRQREAGNGILKDRGLSR